MRVRPLLLFPMLGLVGFGVGCPLVDGSAAPGAPRPANAPAPVAAAAPAPVAVAAAAAPAPVTVTAPASAPASAPAPAPASASAPAAVAEPDTPEAPEPPPDPAAPSAAAAEDPAPAAEEDSAPSIATGEKTAAADVPELGSIAKETWIYAEPRWRSRRIGYLRAGARVERDEKPQSRASCPEGWYRIRPRGYVCVGTNATLDVHHPVLEAAARRPARDGLPYTYVMSRPSPPPLYARLPSEEELRTTEPDLPSHLRKAAQTALDPQFVQPPPADPTPGALLYGQPAPALAGVQRSREALLLGHAKPRSGFALLSTFDHDERRYGLTTELVVLPLDRARVIKPSSFAGLALDAEVTLPVAFVKSRHATRLSPDARGMLRPGAPLAFREALPLTGKSRHTGGVELLEVKDGSFVRADQVLRVDPMERPPGWATAGRKWIDVSILRQSLTAYEGTRPVYVTLVSTGADGLGDPKKTHSTVQGVFRIHTKHVTVTMDGDEVGDEFDLRDVPFVQYFTEGYALHAAYWHDDFGTPRSHGCVNLAPRDAAWLFGWTTPGVPDAWHAALSLHDGTIVYTHP